MNYENMRQDKSSKMKAQIQQDLKQITSNQSVQNSMSYFYENKYKEPKNTQLQALNDTSKQGKEKFDVKLPNASFSKNMMKKNFEDLQDVLFLTLDEN